MAEDKDGSDTNADLADGDNLAVSSPPTPSTSRIIVRTVAAVTTRVESWTQEQAMVRVLTLMDQVGATYFELGGTLLRILTEKWYHPHKTFKAYLNEVGMPYRRANYYIKIYEVMTREVIEWSRFERVGWTKMICLAEVITKENAESWLQTARANSRSHLKKLVSEQLNKVRAGRDGSIVRSSQRVDETLTSSNLVPFPGQRPSAAVAGPGAEVNEMTSCRDSLAGRLAGLDLRELSTAVLEALMSQDDDAIRSVILAIAEGRGLAVSFG